MVYDFHTHTSLSDGELSPVELIRRAVVNGYRAIAITDHADAGTMRRIIQENAEACAQARAHWDILAFPGIELTHVPVAAIAETARQAKAFGARLVIVHGETIVEPVEKGTNRAALSSPNVDILAHPGLITLEEAGLAARNGIMLEISARKGHCLTNGHVAAMAQKAGAYLILSSDAHSPGDLLNNGIAQKIVRGAGLSTSACKRTLTLNPQVLLKKLFDK
jgi:putative hydrolase